jgi:hypothetical protein
VPPEPRIRSLDQIALKRAIIDAWDTTARVSVNARGNLKKSSQYDHFLDLLFSVWTQVLKNLQSTLRLNAAPALVGKRDAHSRSR